MSVSGEDSVSGEEMEEEVEEEDEQEEAEEEEEEEKKEEEDCDDEEEATVAEQGPSVEENKKPRSNLTFAQLGLSPWIVEQLKKLNIAQPTLVQQNCIPKVLEGMDVLGCAKTGTGKTLAFVLPMLQKMAVDPFGVFALIVTPTRELASQIADQLHAVGAVVNAKTATIVGGVGQTEQALQLARRPHFVVATPGRLADHIQSDRESLERIFSRLAFLVLDEGDRMLDGQYALQLKTIFDILPRKRQTLLFSATLTSALSQLQQVSVKKPFFFEEKDDEMVVRNLEQRYVLCPQTVRDAYVVYVVKNFLENRPKSSVIVFSHTCRECQALTYMFTSLGFLAGSLHSQIPQQQRTDSLNRFRAKTIRLLVCTDVAARGLDIPHVDLVVNHSIPESPKTYVHRVGRSARAGRYGSAISFVTQYDIVLLKAIEKLIGKEMAELKVDDKAVSKYVTQVVVSKREAELTLDRQGFGEKKNNEKKIDLLMGGMDEEDVDRYMEEKKNRQQGRGVVRVEKEERWGRRGKEEGRGRMAEDEGRERERGEKRKEDSRGRIGKEEGRKMKEKTKKEKNHGKKTIRNVQQKVIMKKKKKAK